jgi:CRP/FNR family transcriptional regulator
MAGAAQALPPPALFQAVAIGCTAAIRRRPWLAIMVPEHAPAGRVTMDTPIPSTPSATPALPAAAEVQPMLDLAQLQRHMLVGCRRLHAGQYLYRHGQRFQALYLVHAGCLKTCELSADGREQVSGFRMRGDLLGADSIGLATHASDAIALDDSNLWELPCPAVLEACLHVPALQVRLSSALAWEIRRDRSWMLAIGTLPAEQRVAAFLLDTAARMASLGLSGRHFILRMRRVDIASFLVLKHETVSRVLSRLARLKYISVRRREVRLLDLAMLGRCAAMPLARQ